MPRPITLHFHDETIGQFADGGYETPWFHVRLGSLDPTHAARMLKVTAYERAMTPFEDEPEDVYDARADALLAELQLTEEDAFMYSNALLVTFDNGSRYTIGPAYLEEDLLSFRVGDAVT